MAWNMARSRRPNPAPPALRDRRAQHPRAPREALAVGQQQIGGKKGVAQLRVAGHRLHVGPGDAGHEAAAARLRALRQIRHGLIGGSQVHGGGQHRPALKRWVHDYVVIFCVHCWQLIQTVYIMTFKQSCIVYVFA